MPETDLPSTTADTTEVDLVDLGLPEPLLRAVLDLGFTRPFQDRSPNFSADFFTSA